jgi:hypothetical protein
VIYQLLGVTVGPKRSSGFKTFFMWLIMFLLIVFGWLIFRAQSLGWLWNVLVHAPIYRTPQELVAGFVLLVMIGLYAFFLVIKYLFDHYWSSSTNLQVIYYTGATIAIIVFMNSSSPDFIYVQF